MSNFNQPSNNGGQNTNNFTKVSISTNSLSLFDENGSIMKFGFLNETLTVGVLPQITSEGKKTYPTDARVNYVITAERVASLYDNIIMEKVLAAISEGRNYNGGIFLDNKKNRVFEIRVQDGEVYAVYYIDIDADRRPKRTITFKFTKAPIIEKYNPESGEFELHEAHSQFFVFVKMLSGFLECISGVTAHAHKFTNNYQNNKVTKMLEDLCVKMGINITSPRTTPFNNFNGSEETTIPVMSETTDLSNLLG
jgi:hypothetical protein